MMASNRRLLASRLKPDSGVLGSISDVKVQMAFGDERVSVRHRWCCSTELRGRLTLLIRFRVCVSHGSTFEPKATSTDEARGANAAADAGRSCTGMILRQMVVEAGWMLDLILVKDSRCTVAT